MRVVDIGTSNTRGIQESESRIQKLPNRHTHGPRITFEKSTYLFQLFPQVDRGSVAQVTTKDEVVRTFFKRSLRNVKKPHFVQLAALLETLGDVDWY
jgi:hypothetical protein